MTSLVYCVRHILAIYSVEIRVGCVCEDCCKLYHNLRYIFLTKIPPDTVLPNVNLQTNLQYFELFYDIDLSYKLLNIYQ